MITEVKKDTKQKIIKRKKNRLNRKKRKQKKIIALMVMTVCLFVGIFLFKGICKNVKAYVKMNEYNKKQLIYHNIFIDSTNIGEKTKDEALKILRRKYKLKDKKRNLIIKVGEKNYTINFSDLKIDYAFEQAVDEAFSYGRNEKFGDRISIIKKDKKYNIQLNYKFDSSVVHNTLENIEKEINKKAINSSIQKVSSGNFVIKGEETGVKVLTDKIKMDIQESMKNIRHNKDIVINGDTKEVLPLIKREDLLSIDSKISTYTTSFTTSNYNRSTNIDLASQAINGSIIMPGASFSFNDIVGERTAKRGYKTAKVILDNKLVDGFGGGICQVSSTLYNAITRANIMATERAHHTLMSSYVPLGMDATVDYGNIDYKFKNTLPYPIYIEAIINNRILTFNIYSNKSLLKRRYDLINEVNENKVKVYKITYENGVEIDRQLINNDVYSK